MLPLSDEEKLHSDTLWPHLTRIPERETRLGVCSLSLGG